MQINRGILIVMCLLFLGSGAQALLPDQVMIWSDSAWLTAGTGETSNITVRVINNTYPSDPVEGAVVSVWCENSLMGNFTSTQVRTISNYSQEVTFTFRVGNKSGDAVIRASVTHAGMNGTTIEGSTSQAIDHSTPIAFALLSFPSSAPVGNIVQIQVQLKDRYGNIVDSRRENSEGKTAEVVSFRDAEDGDGWFIDGSNYLNTIDKPVNTAGEATVQYRVATKAGDNIILIKPPPTVAPSQTFITIEGFGVLSAEIFADMNPPTGVVYANNQDFISILYTVRDADKNPIRNATIVRTSSLGETATYKTNDQGQVITTYGPKSSIGTVTLIASVQGYPSVMVINTVQFTHTEAVMWELAASPQTLASRDAKEDITADIKAKVMDVLGNPVPGENVTFSIVNVTNSTRLNLTPELVSTMAETDEDGFAIVQLRPGAFPTWGQTGYNQTATGTATVRATWNGRTKEIVITFKNYPYLRVETSVSPQTVKVNEPVDVTVRLVGDGWALRPKPIDVVLCTDRSGSMLYDDPDRMYSVREAAKAFVDEMSTQDRVGLVSFGRNGYISRPGYNSGISTSEIDNTYIYPVTYSNYATLDKSLSYDLNSVKTNLDRIVPDHGTPMREGLRVSISHMASNASPNAVRAVIILSDGDYNWYGDPLARHSSGSTTSPTSSTYYYDLSTYHYPYSTLNSSNQNMSNYAKNNNIRIYAIGYANQITNGGRETLRILAESTGGKYYNGTAANIAEIYRSIAGELKTVAGANTQMNLSFDNVNISFNNITSSMDGSQVFDYRYEPDVSTFVTSWNTTVNPLAGYPYTFDQSLQWNSTPAYLYFNVGNISIGQTWQATFRMVPKVPGSIRMFGPSSSSYITFNGTEGQYSTFLPDTFITVIENMTEEIANQALVDVWITNTSDPGSESMNDFLDVYWVLNYTGNNTVKQVLYYQFSTDNVVWPGESWIKAGTIVTSGQIAPDEDSPFHASIDIRGKSGWLKVKIEAKEQITGGGYDEDIWPSPIQIGPGNRVYIKIS